MQLKYKKLYTYMLKIRWNFVLEVLYCPRCFWKDFFLEKYWKRSFFHSCALYTLVLQWRDSWALAKSKEREQRLSVKKHNLKWIMFEINRLRARKFKKSDWSTKSYSYRCREWCEKTLFRGALLPALFCKKTDIFWKKIFGEKVDFWSDERFLLKELAAQ